MPDAQRVMRLVWPAADRRCQLYGRPFRIVPYARTSCIFQRSPDVVQRSHRPRRSQPPNATRAVEPGAASEHASEAASETALRSDRRLSLKPLLSRPTQARRRSPTHYESSASSARPYCVTTCRAPHLVNHPSSSCFHSSILGFSHFPPPVPPLLVLAVSPLTSSARHLAPSGPVVLNPAGSHTFHATLAIRSAVPFRRVDQYGPPAGKKLTVKDGGTAWLRGGIELGLT